MILLFLQLKIRLVNTVSPDGSTAFLSWLWDYHSNGEAGKLSSVPKENDNNVKSHVHLLTSFHAVQSSFH